MKKIALAVLLILLLAGQAWGATYYTTKVGGAWKYRADAWPTVADGTSVSPNDLQAVFDALLTGDVLVVGKGTYTGTELDSDSTLVISGKSLTVRSPVSTDPDYALYAGDVILDGGGVAGNILTISTASTIQGITIQGTANAASHAAIRIDTAAGTVLSDVVLRDSYFAIRLRASATFNNVNVVSPYSGSIYADGIASTLTFNGGVVENSPGVGLDLLVSGSSATINNVVFVGNRSGAVNAGSGTTVTLNNCIDIANGEGAATLTLRGAGTITANNHLYLPNPNNPSLYSDYSAIGGSNRIVDLPEWAAYREINDEVLCAYMLDDDASIDDWYAALQVAQPGQSIGVVPQTRASMAAYADAGLMPLGINLGHWVGWHSRSHSSISVAEAFSIQYNGAAPAALSVSGDEYATSLTLTAADPNDSVTVAITSTSLISNLITAITAGATGSGYTITSTDNQKLRFARTLANQADMAISNVAATDVLVDETRLFNDEITYALNDLQTTIRALAAPGTPAASYTITSGGYPTNLRTDASDAALHAAGVLGARSNVLMSNSMLASTVNLYDLPQRLLQRFALDDTVDQAVFDAAAKSYYAAARQYGLPPVFWAHGTELDATLTTAFHEKGTTGA